MTNMARIAQAASDYTNLILAEYPDAIESGLGVAVSLPNNGGDFTVTVVPNHMLPPAAEQEQTLQSMSQSRPLPAPEEQLLHPPADTQVSTGDDE